MYKLTNYNTVIKIVDGEIGPCIPMDEGNRDYREYLEWLAKGNTPITDDPVVTPDPVPTPTQEERIAALESAVLEMIMGV